ncbi:MAG TPA: riboflavin synthase [Blastocatellia bacterium]|nr:riboflavin synthase [Blastocatellia bacterium]
MFTGIIEELGTIQSLTNVDNGARIVVNAPTILSDAKIGDSIAVNGVCLTVVEKTATTFAADISAETLRRTSLKQIRVGSKVNLERPMTPNARFGGHIVQGHVDAMGTFVNAKAEGDGWVVRIQFPPELGRYIVEKGSITVDGISLTVAALGDDWFEIAVIPHTWKVTNLATLTAGSAVNLEVDVIAKYVERMLQPHLSAKKSTLTLEKLQEMGY